MATILIALQVLFCTISLIVWPSSIKIIHHRNIDHSSASIQCYMPKEMGILCSIYNLLLIALCTYYAFKSRNIPDNFNEAKFIGFLMYLTCLTYTACSLIYFGSNHKVINPMHQYCLHLLLLNTYEYFTLLFRFKMMAVGITMSVNGFSALFLLFFPKLYIMLWTPERNTRQHFATATGIRCIIGRKDIITDAQLLKM